MAAENESASRQIVLYLPCISKITNHCRVIGTSGNVPSLSHRRRFMAISISLTVNGTPVTAEVEPYTLLVHFIRDSLRLTGTHVGCDTAQCGACTVHVNGRAVKACNMLAVQADGAEVMTIEGLAKDGELHPMQAAFRECHGLQCGFCTPGMVMSAAALAAQQPDITADEVRRQLEGNLCRCTGYHNIVKAVLEGAAAMKRGAAPAGSTSASAVR
jgi:aerobic carbon-monoxide dehydrogenase small subunit